MTTSPTIFVGTADGLHSVGESGGLDRAGVEARSLLRGHKTWWCIFDRSEIARFDGERWRETARAADVKALCLLAANDHQLFVGATEARLLKLAGKSLTPVTSFDAVDRSSWYNPAASAPAVRSMSSDADGTLYVNVHVGGILRSSDGGASWEPTIEVEADVHQVLFDDASGLLLAATGRGLAFSSDRGDSWNFETDGLHGDYLRAVTVAGRMLLVTASTGPFTDEAGVYRKEIGSPRPFARCRHGLPESFDNNIDTANLAGSGTQVAFATPDGSLFRSADQGSSWEQLAEGLPLPRCVVLDRPPRT